MSGFNVGIGCFRKEDYDKILSISDDRDTMNETWEEWKKKSDNMKKSLKKEGYTVVDILVLPPDLMYWCHAKKMRINSEARAQYVQEKVAEMFAD